MQSAGYRIITVVLKMQLLILIFFLIKKGITEIEYRHLV